MLSAVSSASDTRSCVPRITNDALKIWDRNVYINA